MSNRIYFQLLYLTSAAVPGWTFSKCPAERKAVAVACYFNEPLFFMGYELYITRRELWSNDELQERDISLDEWLKYIDKDADLELSDAYRIKVPGSENESQVAPGFCEWLAHPKNKRPWFDYSYGSISTKNPDEETIKKMLSISKTLNAKVQGDDGEIYELTPDSKISYRHLFDEDNKIFYTNPIDADDKDINSSTENKKPWWKFW